MMRDISPEERLFRAIEKGDASPSSKNTQPPPSLAVKTHHSFTVLHKRILELTRKAADSGRKWSFCDIDIEIINKFLIVILAGLIVFFIIDFIKLIPTFEKIYDKISVAPFIQPHKASVVPLDSLAFYINISTKRDLFSPVSSKQPQEKARVERISDLTELVDKLKLVGIYWGKIPEAMIEDTEEKKTYFLKKGQSIKGIKIDSILEDKIILEYNNETLELM